MSDTFTASDFESAATASSSDPAASTSAPVEASAPVETTAQPEGATTQPAVATTELPSTEPAKPAGPIPFDVHKTALDNARTKATAEWDQQYGWAKQVNPQEFQQIRQIASKFANGDVIGGMQELLAEARKDPAVDAQLRSFHGRALAQARQQSPQPVEDQEPQPDLPIQLEDGRVVHLYSAGQQAKREAFLQQQWLESVRQEIQPLRQSHEQQQAAVAQAQWQQAWNQWQSQTVTDAHSWPGMEDLTARAAFAKAVEADIMGRDIKDVREIERAIDRAYRTVIVPSLHTASRKAVLNDINQQANASTVNPAQTSTRAPKAMADMSIAEALQHVAAQSA